MVLPGRRVPGLLSLLVVAGGLSPGLQHFPVVGACPLSLVACELCQGVPSDCPGPAFIHPPRLLAMALDYRYLVVFLSKSHVE